MKEGNNNKKEQFIAEYKKHSGITNAEVVWETLEEFGKFPDSYNGQSVNSFLNSLTSLYITKLLKQIESDSKKQTKQFWVSIFLSMTALLIASATLIATLLPYFSVLGRS